MTFINYLIEGLSMFSSLNLTDYVTIKSVMTFIVILLIVVFLKYGKHIPQNKKYHDFSDTRMLCCVDNSCDVFSNIPFFFFGVYGMINLYNKNLCDVLLCSSWTVFFVGCCLTSFGSAYYHKKPNNDTSMN